MFEFTCEDSYPKDLGQGWPRPLKAQSVILLTCDLDYSTV